MLPEQSFDAFGQLRPPGVPRVHCDEDTHPVIERDLCTFELETLQMMHQSIPNGLNLFIKVHVVEIKSKTNFASDIVSFGFSQN